jgi:hypothetical protein
METQIKKPTHEDVINYLIATFYQYRIGGRSQCRRLAIELLAELKALGVYE